MKRYLAIVVNIFAQLYLLKKHIDARVSGRLCKATSVGDWILPEDTGENLDLADAEEDEDMDGQDELEAGSSVDKRRTRATIDETMAELSSEDRWLRVFVLDILKKIV